MKILYLITARAGSKGLPNKNFKPLNGKPLFMYSVDFALNHMKNDDELCISTNDDTLIAIANSANINVPFRRPEHLASDTASSQDVILHAVNYYEELGKNFDAVMLLQPTSPFRKEEDYQQIVNEFQDDCDMVVSVKLAKENPYFTLFEENKDGFLKKSKDSVYTRRQDCPSVYAFNGSIYLIRVYSLKSGSLGNFSKIKKVVMPEERSVDIDTMADWILAEYYLSKQ